MVLAIENERWVPIREFFLPGVRRWFVSHPSRNLPLFSRFPFGLAIRLTGTLQAVNTARFNIFVLLPPAYINKSNLAPMITESRTATKFLGNRACIRG